MKGGRVQQFHTSGESPAFWGQSQPPLVRPVTHRFQHNNTGPPRGGTHSTGSGGLEGGVPVRGGNAPTGPCFQCGQWGHWKQECPLMECDVADDSLSWVWEGAWQAATEEDSCP